MWWIAGWVLCGIVAAVLTLLVDKPDVITLNDLGVGLFFVFIGPVALAIEVFWALSYEGYGNKVIWRRKP